MTALPTPFVQADCDLRDFAFMPLDVVRLRDSDIAALSSGDEFRSAVLLWCASWHQVPASSLPDDDVVLSQLAGYGRVVREWKKVRDGALRGWVKCSDGRLYHPVVAEKAREAWEEKSRYAYSKLCERLRKAGVPRDKTPSYEVWLSSGKQMDFHWKESGIPDRTPEPSAGIPPENALKGQGQGQGQGQVIKTPPAPRAGANEPDAGEPFSMHSGWRPSEQFGELARMSGMPDISHDALGEFVAYWLSRPERKRMQAEWDHAYLKNLKATKARPQAQSPPARSGRRSKQDQQFIAARSVFGTRENHERTIDGSAERIEDHTAIAGAVD